MFHVKCVCSNDLTQHYLWSGQYYGNYAHGHTVKDSHTHHILDTCMQTHIHTYTQTHTTVSPAIT